MESSVKGTASLGEVSILRWQSEVESVPFAPFTCICGAATKAIQFHVPPEGWLVQISRCPSCDAHRPETRLRSAEETQAPVVAESVEPS
jgi:hypothetical protein